MLVLHNGSPRFHLAPRALDLPVSPWCRWVPMQRPPPPAQLVPGTPAAPSAPQGRSKLPTGVLLRRDEE